MPVMSSLNKLRQDDQEFKVNLRCIDSSAHDKINMILIIKLHTGLYLPKSKSAFELMR